MRTWQPTPAIYVDEIPILFGGSLGADVLKAAIGERVRVGPYDGEYPLRGHMLIRSLSVLDEVEPLLAHLR